MSRTNHNPTDVCQFLTAVQVNARLGVSTGQIYCAIHSGHLVTHRYPGLGPGDYSIHISEFEAYRDGSRCTPKQKRATLGSGDVTAGRLQIIKPGPWFDA